MTGGVSWLRVFCIRRHGLLSVADESHWESLLLAVVTGCSRQELEDLHLRLHFALKSFQQSLWICWVPDTSPKRYAWSWKQCVFVGSGAPQLLLLPRRLRPAPPRTGCRASGLATCWHTSLKENHTSLKECHEWHEDDPSMRILSPHWHFFLVYSSSSCLKASLVVAGVKEASSCSFPACGRKQVKAVSLWCSGYSVSALPGRWQCLFCLIPPELTLSFVAPC